MVNRGGRRGQISTAPEDQAAESILRWPSKLLRNKGPISNPALNAISEGSAHVMVVGLRGFPGVQGGVETHAQHLYPAIAAAGFRVTVALRSPYIRGGHPSEWNGVKFVKLWAPRSKSMEAIVHTFLAIMYAAFRRPDVLHIQAIGPALLTPLARFFGLKVVVTHHGADYDRQKWGPIGKSVLRFGEALGMRSANKRIAVSRTMQAHVRKKFGLEAACIRNGVEPSVAPSSRQALEKFRLKPRKYILTVSRMVPEKRHLDLIEAFTRAELLGWKLVLVGGSVHSDAYFRSIEDLAAKTRNVVATGFQEGLALRELYGHAGLFVLPSSHEGLPIALLEALSYGLPTLVSDIEPHLEIELPTRHYFRMGDVDALAEAIKRMVASEVSEEWSENLKQWTSRRFNWSTSALETIAIYRSLIG
ncbi:MAG: glycosyltransferase family 4 protein [Pseudomonadota bacterium]|nr:glycosyltransferase family 4 protein [Pseudomonadota bacterium]